MIGDMIGNIIYIYIHDWNMMGILWIIIQMMIQTLHSELGNHHLE